MKLTMKMFMEEIKRLNKNKASQNSDIPITIIHKNAEIIADFLAEYLKGGKYICYIISYNLSWYIFSRKAEKQAMILLKISIHIL